MEDGKDDIDFRLMWLMILVLSAAGFCIAGVVVWAVMKLFGWI